MYGGDGLEILFVFFFNDTATTEIYTLSLHDALPISRLRASAGWRARCGGRSARPSHDRRGNRVCRPSGRKDRKSTRLNSSHANISYAAFCLKKKKLSPVPLPTAFVSSPTLLASRYSP